MRTNNPHDEVGSFKKPIYRRNEYRPEPQAEKAHIAIEFFFYYEYAHPNYKELNPHKKEFIEFFNSFVKEKEDRALCLYQLFKLYKKRYSKPIKPEWIENRPPEITSETLRKYCEVHPQR